MWGEVSPKPGQSNALINSSATTRRKTLMNIRTFPAALLIACSAITVSAQPSATQDPEPLAAVSVNRQEIQITAANTHGPSLVAYCSVCGGLVSSTGNLYFTNFGISEFGPSSASFYRTGKYSTPGSEGLLYAESGPVYFDFGNVVWAYAGGTYYGYFVANYDRFGVRMSEIKRVPLAGGAPVILAQSPAYIGAGDLATDGSTLFWADAGGVRSVSVFGGAIHTLVSSASVSHISLDASYVYYSEGVRTSRVAKAGGAATALLFAPAKITALYVWAASPSYTLIFWGEQGGAVRSNNAFGSSPWTWQSPIAGRDVTSVGYDGTRALWIDCAEPGNPQCNVKVQSGGVQPATVNAGAGAGHLQWDPTSMYWIALPGIQRYVY
jgi:hypothetical protein